MPRRQQEFAIGETYHVYNRGVDRQPIFFERKNWGYFLLQVRKYLLAENTRGESTPAAQSSRSAERGVDVLAYCLMPNHFHLVVRLLREDFSYRMQLLSQSYTNAINKARSRVGPLFQGRFRAVQVDEAAQLLHLTRYVHRNPLEARLVGSPEEWEFSSYREYLGHRRGSLPSINVVLQEFDSRDAYRCFVEGRPPAPAGFESLLIDGET